MYRILHNSRNPLIFQALRSSTATILKPGRNTITLALPPQRPGSYVLGVLTGQIGQLRFRSHSFSKGGPADSDDFMSYEKPTRPILKVLVLCFIQGSCILVIPFG